MRKCIDMGKGREIIINDKDMLKLMEYWRFRI